MTRPIRVGALLAMTCALVLGSAGEDRAAPRYLVVPLGLDRYVPAPLDNPITTEKIALGRRLFFEEKLSKDGRTSCATCHQPPRRFTDGRRLARGVFDREGRRNTPSILNRAYGGSAFWDGRAATLEDQVRAAITGDRHLGLPTRISTTPASHGATDASGSRPRRNHRKG